MEVHEVKESIVELLGDEGVGVTPGFPENLVEFDNYDGSVTLLVIYVRPGPRKLV